jgi:hypothetical protein
MSSLLSLKWEGIVYMVDELQRLPYFGYMNFLIGFNNRVGKG